MQFINASWPAPTWIKAICTTRHGGVSKKPYHQLNLGDHVGDETTNVYLNRLRLQQQLNLKAQPLWLNQTHSTRVIDLEQTKQNDADGAYTRQRHQVCAVLTADCLPVLICNTQGTLVSAIHCGWRGILNGILENAVTAMQAKCSDTLLVWLGPAIGADVYEVGQEVRDAFVQIKPKSNKAFTQISQTKYLANLPLLAAMRLRALGIHQIYGGDYCTYSQAELFFSFRREQITGRMASLIWIGDH